MIRLSLPEVIEKVTVSDRNVFQRPRALKKQPIPLDKIDKKSTLDFRFDPNARVYDFRASWKQKIVFALGEIHLGSIDDVAIFLFELEPEKNLTEITTYVSWYVDEMSTEELIVASGSTGRLLYSLK